MRSYVYQCQNLMESNIYPTYKKHAQMLKLITPDTPVLLFVGKGNMFSKFPYLICTNDCVIMADPTKILNNTAVLPYRSISSCITIPGKFGLPKVSFGIVGSISESYNPPFLTQQDAQQICNFILEKVQPISMSYTVSPENDSFSDIEKLSELKDKGIITDEEFRLKKKQLLGI
jgi:hypothetical protein